MALSPLASVFGNGAVFLCHHPAASRYLAAMPRECVEEGFALALALFVVGTQLLYVFHLQPSIINNFTSTKLFYCSV
jgi:hypothetical protein